MATKSPVLILAVLGTAAFFLFSGKREQRFDPSPGGPTARPQPITSTRPTVRFGEDAPGGGISFGGRDPLPIPPVPFIGPTLPTTRPDIVPIIDISTTRPDPTLRVVRSQTTGAILGGRTAEGAARVDALNISLINTGLAGPLSALTADQLRARALAESLFLDDK